MNGSAPGHLRDRFPARLAQRSAARAARRRARARDGRRLDRARPRLHRARPDRRRARTLALAGAPGQWAFPAADTLAGARYVGHAFPAEDQGVSYTLRGRIESRLAALLPVLLGVLRARRCAASLVAGRGRLRLMIGVGLVLDVQVYAPAAAVPVRAGSSLPLGLVELGLRAGDAATRAGLHAPLGPALALFAGGLARRVQLLGHAGFPLLRLELCRGRRRARPRRRRRSGRRAARPRRRGRDVRTCGSHPSSTSPPESTRGRS